MLACPVVDDQGVLGDLWLINQKNYAFNDLDSIRAASSKSVCDRDSASPTHSHSYCEVQN